jgi:tetratricopeptide (TPR) repeat protein
MTLHLIEAAEQAEESGDFEKALQIWCQLASEKGKAIYFSRWGNAAQRLARWDEAEKAFGNALAADSRFSSAMEGLGLLFFHRTDGNQQSNIERARDWYLNALLINRYARTFNLLGIAYIELGLLEDAKDAFLEAIDIDDSYSESYFNLAALEKKEDPRKAKALLEKCIALDPDWMAAYFNLALLVREENVEKAKVLFEKAIELNFNELPPHREFGKLLQKEGSMREAEGEFRRCLEIAPKDCWSRLYLANNLAVQGRDPEAEREYRIAINLCQDTAAAVHLFANFLDSISRSDEANVLRSQISEKGNDIPSQN